METGLHKLHMGLYCFPWYFNYSPPHTPLLSQVQCDLQAALMLSKFVWEGMGEKCLHLFIPSYNR